jgi:hypothetical protein
MEPSRPLRRTPFFLLTIAVVAACFLNATVAHSQDSPDIWISVLKFSGGVAAAYALHEGAHWTVAEITGTHLHWEAGSYNQPIAFTENGTGDTDGVLLYSAGLVAQLASSEVILDVDRINKNDAFVRGMMAWNIINPIVYALDYWFFHLSNDASDNSYQGDIKGIEHYSSKETANVFAGSMVAIAAFQGYRFLKTQSWAPAWIRGDSYQLTFDRTPDAGLQFGLKFSF